MNWVDDGVRSWRIAGLLERAIDWHQVQVCGAPEGSPGRFGVDSRHGRSATEGRSS